MQAHRIELTIENGKLVIDNLPFQDGETVEVIILPAPKSGVKEWKSLEGTVLKYIDPFEPVAQDDWEANA